MLYIHETVLVAVLVTDSWRGLVDAIYLAQERRSRQGQHHQTDRDE